MNLNQDLLSKISEKIDVIVWFENKTLSPNLSAFKTMDYILDGLLTEHLKHFNDTKECTFVHTHFGKKLQVIYCGSNKKMDLSYLQTNEKEFGLIINSSGVDFHGKAIFDQTMKWVDEVRL